MMELHITTDNYTTELVRRAGITPSILIYTFPMSFLNDRSLWRGYLPPQIRKFDKVIFWHEDDVNSRLLLALLSTLQVKLWHIEIPLSLQEEDVPLFYPQMQPIDEDQEPASRQLWEYALKKPKEPMTKISSSPYGYKYNNLIDIFSRGFFRKSPRRPHCVDLAKSDNKDSETSSPEDRKDYVSNYFRNWRK